MSKSLEWRHMAAAPLSLSVGDDTAPAAAEEEEAEEEATSLLVVVAEDINYVGVTLLKNIIGEKRKREGGLHCTAPFSSPPPLPVAGLARLLPPPFPPPLSPFRPYFFAAAFTEICSAQKSPPFFAKMWQFMRRCRAE